MSGCQAKNPWDSINGDWACYCRICVEMRLAWPNTTELWKPLPSPTNESPQT